MAIRHDPNSMTSNKAMVEVDCNALKVDGKHLPLFSGEMHFWRIAPEHWESCLGQLKKLGLDIVATYLSWRRHSATPGQTDLTGCTDPRLDLPGFLKLCQRVGLWVHLKPGPWICAEEINGGYPDWLLEDTELLVRNHRDQILLGGDAPLQNPLPSYLHPKYLAHVKRWIQEVSDCIRPFCYRAGPVLLIQLDNEPSMAFHDAMFEADYGLANDGPAGFFCPARAQRPLHLRPLPLYCDISTFGRRWRWMHAMFSRLSNAMIGK